MSKKHGAGQRESFLGPKGADSKRRRQMQGATSDQLGPSRPHRWGPNRAAMGMGGAEVEVQPTVRSSRKSSNHSSHYDRSPGMPALVSPRLLVQQAMGFPMRIARPAPRIRLQTAALYSAELAAAHRLSNKPGTGGWWHVSAGGGQIRWVRRNLRCAPVLVESAA